MKRFFVAPFELHERIIALIDREAENARQKLPARIVVKMNSLAEPRVIEALYRASEAGAQIDLIIRGICCLRPGVKGVSSNIRVCSIVDRFLEHSRVLYFENGGKPEIFVTSADWMRRNFFRRLEICFPIEDSSLRKRVVETIFATQLADNTKAWDLLSDGTYQRRRPGQGEQPRCSQSEFMALAENAARIHDKKNGRARRYPRVELAPRPWVAAGSRTIAAS